MCLVIYTLHSIFRAVTVLFGTGSGPIRLGKSKFWVKSGNFTFIQLFWKLLKTSLCGMCAIIYKLNQNNMYFLLYSQYKCKILGISRYISKLGIFGDFPIGKGPLIYGCVFILAFFGQEPLLLCQVHIIINMPYTYVPV